MRKRALGLSLLGTIWSIALFGSDCQHEPASSRQDSEPAAVEPRGAEPRAAKPAAAEPAAAEPTAKPTAAEPATPEPAGTIPEPTAAPTKSPPASARSTPASADGASAPAAVQPAAVAASCRVDGDCHTVDDLCGSCRCLALPVGTTQPKCRGTAVQCFVAPCREKAAVCREGSCALVDRASSAM